MRLSSARKEPAVYHIQHVSVPSINLSTLLTPLHVHLQLKSHLLLLPAMINIQILISESIAS